MADHQVDQFESVLHGTILQIFDFNASAGDVTVDATNPHAYQVFTFQINSSPVGDYDFFISYDAVNFIPARTWSMGGSVYTTTTTGVGIARYSVNVSGARTFRIIKRTPAAASIVHLRQHHFVNSHLQRGKH